MNINCLICSDCDTVMTVYDLYDFYCVKNKMVIKIEERICLHCSAKVLQVINLQHVDDPPVLGRSESLEITCTGYRQKKELPQSLISELIHIHYLEYVKKICFQKTQSVWYKGFELDLWESINGNNHLKLAEEQIFALMSFSKNLNKWVINPEDWEDQAAESLPFVSMRTWNRLYKLRHEKFKTHELGSYFRNPASDTESG